MVESRLYGELVPCLACMGALIAEQSILARMAMDAQPREPVKIPPKTIVPPPSSRDSGTVNIQKTRKPWKNSNCART